MTHTDLNVLLVVAGFIAARLLLTLVRYVRYGREMRASVHQSFRVRRGWDRLAKMTGLSVTDRKPTLLAGMLAQKGETPAPRVLVPKIKITADRFGVVVRAKCLPKVGLEEFQRSARYLADAWQCTRVSVLPDGPGRVVIRGVRLDPLTVPTTHVPTGLPPQDIAAWHLGMDEYAGQVVLSLSNVAGVCIAGLPGTGKTSTLNRLVCDFGPSNAVQFAVADGKASTWEEGDYADLRSRLFAFAGDDLGEANELFKRLVRLRRSRASAIRGVLGVKNMWNCGPSEIWPLTILIIDEAHTYFRDYKGNDAETKRLAMLSAENARLVEDLVKKGRSVGMMVILTTQKATGDAIPTFIRDVCALGLSFAQKTTDAAVAALGDDIRNWPDANPVNLQDPAYVGVAAMSLQGREGFTRVRTPQVSDADAARVAEATSHLTQDPAAFLDNYPGPVDWKPSFAKDPDMTVDDEAA